jgi:hypothetical protein
MSGGHFDYIDGRLREIVDDLVRLNNNRVTDEGAPLEFSDEEADELLPGDPVRMLPQLGECPELAGPWTVRTEKLAAKLAAEHRRKEPVGSFVKFEVWSRLAVVRYPGGGECAISRYLLERVET